MIFMCGAMSAPKRERNEMFKMRQEVRYQDRPAVIMTKPSIGATGREMIGVRFTDVPQFEDCPGFPGMKMPAKGSCAIACTDDITAA
jgi:hypothetical protein